MNPYDYVAAHQDKFLEDLKEVLRIPSISAVSEHNADSRRAAEWFKAKLQQMGMTRTEIYDTAGNPIVYGEWLGADDAPTVLIYGHYDVQPADDPDQMWKTDPFEPVVLNGNLYARGATDDKGQTFTQMKAVEALLQSGQMSVNVKFVIEGEEEMGSGNLYPFIEQHVDLLKSDVAIISDTSMLGLDHPSIVYGLRGIVSLEIEVKGPAHDLHSGTYGGAVHNPAKALVDIMSALHNPDNSIAVPGFYDRVRPVSDAERAELAKTPLPIDRLRAEAGVEVPWGEEAYALHERLGIRPTLEINGLVSGWTGEGGKTVLPAKALAKVSCRLVADQDPVEIVDLIRKYVQQITPPSVTSEVRLLHKGLWAMVEQDSPYMQAALRAYEFGFGKRPVFVREGGSVPIVGTFQKVLNVPVIMMGFGLPDDNLHAPNEKYTLECFYRGMRTAIHFYQAISASDFPH